MASQLSQLSQLSRVVPASRCLTPRSADVSANNSGLEAQEIISWDVVRTRRAK
jgi:hypothetical protein